MPTCPHLLSLKNLTVFVAFLHLIFLTFRSSEIAFDIRNEYVVNVNTIAPIITIIVLQFIVVALLIAGAFLENRFCLLPWLLFTSSAFLFALLTGSPTVYLATHDSYPGGISLNHIFGIICVSLFVVLTYYIKLTSSQNIKYTRMRYNKKSYQ